MQIDWPKLTTAAEQASMHAYAKYSNFAVGAAVLTADGRIFSGANVENASFGLTICAERAAAFAAVSAGATVFVAVAIYTPTDEPVAPCGACRQVLAEFARDMPVHSICKAGVTAEYSFAELLPHTFRFD